MKGILTYWVKDGVDSLKSVKLTLCSDDDSKLTGSAEIRRRRLVRILDESRSQKVRLSYGDLAMILLVSRATIKRDFSYLRRTGLVGVSGGSDNG